MNIGEVAQASRVSAKMIRHYEWHRPHRGQPAQPGGLPATSRVRRTPAALHPRRARSRVFARAVKQLLSLWVDPVRASADVKRLAETHIAELDSRVAALTEMRTTLVTLAQSCNGDHRPDCPTRQGLAAPPA